MKTFCPECGFGVKVDEDGCCLSCGLAATGSAVDALYSLAGTGPVQATVLDNGVIFVEVDGGEQIV